MRLTDFFTHDAVDLALTGATKDLALVALVQHLGLGRHDVDALLRVLHRREQLGPTGIGRGIAIPHARSLVVKRLRLVFGRHREGIDYGAIDGHPVHYLFLIVAPPLEISNQYLPVLGKIAQFAGQPDVPDRLAALGTVDDFFRLLEAKGV